MMLTIRPKFNVVFFALVLLFATIFPPYAFAQPPLRIGAVLPLTGDLQAQGAPSLNGVMLAAKEINRDGGVLGQKIKIFSGDTQTLPQQGVNSAKQLVNANGVVGLVGAMSSGVTIPVALSVAKRNKIPEISTGSTSPKITTLNDHDFLFRDIPSDALQGVALANIVINAGVKNISIMYVNNAYGEGLKDAFSRIFKNKGGNVVNIASYEQKQSTYSAEINEAYGNGSAKSLLLLGYPAYGQVILRQSLEGGKFKKFFFADGMKSTSLVKNLGAKYLAGSLGTAPTVKKGTIAIKRFRKSYRAEYEEEPPAPYIKNAYDATYLLALAAEKAKTSVSGVKIRDQLRSVANPPGERIYPGQWSKAVKLIDSGKDINWVGAAGDENFDEHGDISSDFGEWKITKGGAIKTVRVFSAKAKD